MITKKTISLLLLLFLTNAHAVTDACQNKTIISQTPYVTALVEYLGVKECIIGASRYDKQVHSDMPRTGGVIDPDKEIVARLQADFLITSEWTNLQTLKDITPKKTQVIRLHSFTSIEEIQNNIYEVAKALALDNPKERALRFANDFDTLAKSVHANNKKVLLLSACSDTPYSYGTNTWLGDMFSKAGFDVVDKSPKLKSFTTKELSNYINTHTIDYLVFFTSHGNSCNTLPTTKRIKKLYFDGELFLSPAPTVLQALKVMQTTKENY